MQEQDLNIKIGPVNHSGEGFQVVIRKGKSDPQYMSNCKFCGENISLHIHQDILTGKPDSFLCTKCGKMHNKAETISLVNAGRWVTPTCNFYIDSHNKQSNLAFLEPHSITVLEEIDDYAPKKAYMRFHLAYPEIFKKRVKIMVKTKNDIDIKKILKDALKETMEEMKPATSGICSLEDVEFKTIGVNPMGDTVSYKIVGWTSDKKHRELKSGFITGSIESEAAKEMLAKRININDIAFAVIDEGYHTKAVRDFAALHKIKVATMRLVNKNQQADRYDDCFILASNAADKVIKANKKMNDEERAKEETKNPFSNELGDENLFNMEDFPSLAKERLTKFNPAKIIVTSTPNSMDICCIKNFITARKKQNSVLGGLFDRIKENQAKRKIEDLWLKNTNVFGFNIELNYFDVLKEIKKPNSAAIVGVSNDDGEFQLSLSEFVSAYFKEGLELCDAAIALENALTTLSKAKDTEDDYLITCAELAVEESRDEVAFWSEGFKLLHSTNKCE